MHMYVSPALHRSCTKETAYQTDPAKHCNCTHLDRSLAVRGDHASLFIQHVGATDSVVPVSDLAMRKSSFLTLHCHAGAPALGDMTKTLEEANLAGAMLVMRWLS